MSEIKISVDKEKLLNTLKKNLDNHTKMYQESLDGFKKFARETLELKLKSLENGKIDSLNVNFSPPVNHTKDYERAIQMVDWHKTGTIDLTSEDFSCLVLDSWGWIGAWLQSNKRFSKITDAYANSKGL